MHNGLYLIDDIKRLHVSRKGGRGLITTGEYVDATIQGVEDCTKNSKERPVRVANNSIDNIRISRKATKSRKQLYGYFKQQTREIVHEMTWKWLRKENPKRETESLLIAAHSNSIRTNYIKAKVDNTQQNSKRRFCRDGDETINHIINKRNTELDTTR